MFKSIKEILQSCGYVGLSGLALKKNSSKFLAPILHRQLGNFYQQENESIADLHTVLTVLLEKCNYNQSCMNTHKAGLFMHAVTYFAVCSWPRKQPADVAHIRLLDKAKCHETVVAEYHLDKESKQDSMAFPALSSTSIDAVYFLYSIRTTAWSYSQVLSMHIESLRTHLRCSISVLPQT